MGCCDLPSHVGLRAAGTDMRGTACTWSGWRVNGAISSHSPSQRHSSPPGRKWHLFFLFALPREVHFAICLGEGGSGREGRGAGSVSPFLTKPAGALTKFERLLYLLID